MRCLGDAWGCELSNAGEEGQVTLCLGKWDGDAFVCMVLVCVSVSMSVYVLISQFY